MEFIPGKIYQYNEIADMLANKAIESNTHIIGLTGTSSVGKSTFASFVKAHIENYGYTAQILSADNYLKDSYKAGTNFWNRIDSPYLTPAHFDWKALSLDTSQLLSYLPVTKDCYIRGTGWGNEHIFTPTEFYIIEGLFLDSSEASDFMNYDLLISLTADDALVRSLRIERDAYYRKTSKTFTRTEEETLEEIKNTLTASKSYTIAVFRAPYIRLHAKGSYNATIHIRNV